MLLYYIIGGEKGRAPAVGQLVISNVWPMFKLVALPKFVGKKPGITTHCSGDHFYHVVYKNSDFC
jgi:hypothetical protein